MTQDIRPPRVDFGEVRNARGEIIGSVTISKAWFFWLRDLLRTQDDSAIEAIFDSVYGVAATAEAAKAASEAQLLALLPIPQQDFGPQIDEARLLGLREAPPDFAADIEAVRIACQPRAEHGTSAARIAARVLVGL